MIQLLGSSFSGSFGGGLEACRAKLAQEKRGGKIGAMMVTSDPALASSIPSVTVSVSLPPGEWKGFHHYLVIGASLSLPLSLASTSVLHMKVSVVKEQLYSSSADPRFLESLRCTIYPHFPSFFYLKAFIFSCSFSDPHPSLLGQQHLLQQKIKIKMHTCFLEQTTVLWNRCTHGCSVPE